MIVQSFWFGGPLTPYENLCVQSFLDHGHAYHLYTYDPGLALPGGAERRDASSILPESDVVLSRQGVSRGSVALFSDRFRYELLARLGGWWVDTDVVCLGRALPGADLFYAFERPDRVNSAILRLPAGHAVARACRDRAGEVGPDAPWGSTGPRLLTSVLAELGLLDRAAPASTCYPFDWDEVPLLYDPARTEELRERTRGAAMIHLWNEMARRAGINKTVGVPPGSYLDTLFSAHKIVFPAYPLYSAADVVRLDENRRGDDQLVGSQNRVNKLEGLLRERERDIAALKAEAAARPAGGTPMARERWRRWLDGLRRK